LTRDDSLCRWAGSLDGSDILLLDFILTLKPLVAAAHTDLGIGTLHSDALDLATSASLAGFLEPSHRLVDLSVGGWDSGGAVHGLVGLIGLKGSEGSRATGC
jgi:hypothetical protein